MNYELFRAARDFGRYGILDSKKKVWFFRILLIIIIVITICRLCGLFGSALTVSTYNDVLGNNTVCNNLLSFVPSNMKYVIFQDSESSYYCFYGQNSDFTLTSNSVSASQMKYVRYYRSGNYSNYNYVSGSADLNLSVSNVIASNLKTDFLSSENFNYAGMSVQYISFIALLVFFPIVMITNIRRLGREYY